jgi:hypothetical protein
MTNTKMYMSNRGYVVAIVHVLTLATLLLVVAGVITELVLFQTSHHHSPFGKFPKLLHANFQR